MNFEAAAAYAERHALEAMFAVRDGEVVFERYADGFDAEAPHALYSGTKSFWGVTALAARADGLLTLDELVGDTFPAWREGLRARVTLRHLLQLTSGIGFGGLGNAVPTYEKALAVQPKTEPGETFTYGGIPLQVFGAVFARKLAPSGRTPHDYLRERILDPIGCTIATWRTLKDGTHPLPTGAFLSARAWAAYGAFVAARGLAARNDGLFDELAAGSSANPRYGLGWWLHPVADDPSALYASGSGGQALYVFPNHRIAVAKFAKSASFAHATFINRLIV